MSDCMSITGNQQDVVAENRFIASLIQLARAWNATLVIGTRRYLPLRTKSEARISF